MAPNGNGNVQSALGMDPTSLALLGGMMPMMAPQASATAEEAPAIKKVSIICSKGALDMAYPGLILANAARMSGIEAVLFFTFWGLDIVTKKKVDHLKMPTVGNPSMGVPTWLGGFPGMQAIATKKMKSTIDKLEIPPVHELVETLGEAGAEMYACKMAMEMMELEQDDLLPEVDSVITAMDFFDKSRGAAIIFI